MVVKCFCGIKQVICALFSDISAKPGDQVVASSRQNVAMGFFLPDKNEGLQTLDLPIPAPHSSGT